MTHTNPFAPDPQNPAARLSSQELEERADAARNDPHAMGPSVPAGDPELEELSRREDVTRAVELWEQLCAVDFVRGETQGYYTHSTAHLTPETTGHSGHASGRVHRMPDAAEIEALILFDGEETAYPPHDAQPEYDPAIPDLTPEQRAATYYHEDKNPWSGDDRLYPITLTLISCGDYHGSDVDAANNRALQGTPGVTVSEPNTGGQGSVFNVSTTVVGEMSSFENSQTVADWEREPAQRRADALMWLESLVGQMEGLIDYALLDGETHSALIYELADEAWSSYLEADTFDALLDLAPDDGNDWEDRIEHARSLEESANTVQTAYFGYEENEWNAESATSVVNGRHEDAVKHVARTLFGWDVS